ncbi:MAG: site-specific DNA-methyltransferase [Ponticaulis sp.]|nr:site-specific DNA-methyltransferase [Ponticaulis sp.]|tara:strand:- start:37003 stop:39891 length:2889 start_codon:yes stop_codon:yes gene_type:complete
MPSNPSSKKVDALKHTGATRKNIPTAELQSAAQRAEEMQPVKPVTYERRFPLASGEVRERDGDLDPQIIWKGAKIRLTPEQIEQLAETGEIDIGEAQLVWRGKDTQDWSDLLVAAPPLYIQEKVHPKAIIDDLVRHTKDAREVESDIPNLFHDFNGVDPEAKTEFYAHDQNWSNRMILGDSLQVMASLAEREALRGKVQCIYFDPPYGIKFNSNWQVSTRSRDVKDGKLDQITREPEQVRAFRDTWKDGIHSYLTYLRDRLTAMRDLLTESGSIFVQIGDENVHRVRALMDEVFGEESFVSQIAFSKGAAGLGATGRIAARLDYILWYSKSQSYKYRPLYELKDAENDPNFSWLDTPSRGLVRKSQASAEELKNGRLAQDVSLTKPGPGAKYSIVYQGKTFESGNRWWGTPKPQLERALRSGKIIRVGNSLRHLRYLDESGLTAIGNVWDGFLGQYAPVYVVQTNTQIAQRCILMASDPGDIVLDPTCGSGTSAVVAEQWGRRWITIDTSRVALALARTRMMTTRYPYYLLADSHEGRQKEGALTGKPPSDAPVRNDVSLGFVYERAPRVTLKSIANNTEIDVIWEEYQKQLEPLSRKLNDASGNSWEEWEIPREPEAGWSSNVIGLHKEWWKLRIERQQKIDASIAQKADVELLYDRPYADTSRVRVAGPFTVETLSPHRVIPADDYELIDEMDAAEGKRTAKETPPDEFAKMILEHLKSSGVQQSAKEDRISFTAIEGWPGDYIAATGTFTEGSTEKRAAIFIGPEFGTVARADLTAAAREALDARFDVLIACGFNFEAHTSELNKLGPLPILKAKMNPELHMSDELKNTGSGNLFVVFGEPDIEWKFLDDGQIEVEVLGVDVFDPKTGEVRASGKDDIAAWFIDTDYDEESFFVRHAYFLGANDPYKQLKTSLRAEIHEEAWETLYRDTSRPFPRPSTGRFAVKVINHFGDEVMKVFGV